MSQLAENQLNMAASLTISNQVSELPHIINWLEQIAKENHLSQNTVFKLDLVLNEVIANIIDYAYEDNLQHDIVITFENYLDYVVLEIIDDGVPFNPLTKAPPTQVSSLVSAKIDGRGIILINAFTDGRTYERIKQTNVLRARIHKIATLDIEQTELMLNHKHSNDSLERFNAEKLEPREFISANRDLLAAIPLFSGLSVSFLEPFLLQCEYRRMPAKTVLLAPDQTNQNLYLLLSGQLTIHVESLASAKGFTVLPGEFVGEVSIIDGLAPTACVSASEDSVVLCIHETILWEEFFKIQGLARNMFKQFAGRMRARNKAIQQSMEQTLRLEHLEKELCIAHDLQANMLPSRPFFPNHPQAETEAIMYPAKEIGGDFYDCFPLDAERVCIAVGDVAGKGIPAALFMVRTLTLLRTEMLKCKDLLQAIHALNENLSHENSGCMFVTMMICVIDLNKGQFYYVNGGHNRPLFGNFKNGFHFLVQPKGILVGIDPDAIYQMESRKLHDGDMVILYTDGITEALNPGLEEYTEQRLQKHINRQHEQSIAEFINGVCASVTDFAATTEQSDDLTLLVFRYRGDK